MSVALYMDENVKGPITRGLRRRGIDVMTAQGDIPPGTPDPEVLDRATELGRVLFSQDDDLVREAAKRQRSGESFTGVIYAHQDTVSIGQCVQDLEFLAQAGHPEDFENRVEYLPLR